MSAKEQRLDLLIDVFTLKRQRASALPTLTSAELILAVLQEFGGRQVLDDQSSPAAAQSSAASGQQLKIAFLGDNPNDYQLLRADSRQPLDASTPIGDQLFPNERLVIVEQDLPLPQGTTRPTKAIYLRDQRSGKVFKLHWLPAIVGRWDANQPDNDRVAVNLATYTTGQRVSRRHAQIGQAGPQFYIERLSPNPTSIRDANGKTIQLGEKEHLLRNGDTVVLEGSEIALEFIVREQEPAA